ncbi:hypothetical protein AB833_06190 [Chromatiales bacterium (ex Bugula neritina AB1)]|nr:hypothetical protein AB833_06190 [Chromatiales bacterium (ex Bugula neritina AB1)]
MTAADDYVNADFKLRNVCRRWGSRVALNGVNVEIGNREKVALIGPSGGGKSTLIRLLAGVLRPSSGSVKVNGSDIAGFSRKRLKLHRRRCGIIQQGHMLVPQLNVHQNVLSGALSNWPWYKVALASIAHLERPRVQMLLKSLGLADYQWETVQNLSGGQMQRVAVARALIAEPSVLLADEATASLDPTTARNVTSLIIDQANTRNTTLFFCTHWVDLVMQRSDRIIGIRDGQICLNAPPGQVSDEDLEYLYRGSDERQ